MARDPFMVLLQLGAVTVIAVGVVLLLLRTSARSTSSRGGMVQGYPPSLFPRQDLVRSGQLAALAATQARLLALYEQAPIHSDLAVWLQPFLHELRAIMDTAYRAMAIAHVYDQQVQLDRLVAEVREAELQIASQALQRMLARDGDAELELLDGRLATLRMCARELARAAAEQPAPRSGPPG